MSDLLLSGIVSLFVAAAVSFLANRLSEHSQKRQFDRDTIRKLFLPLIPEIVACFDTATAFRKGHDIAKELTIQELEEKFLLHTEKHVEYVDAGISQEILRLKNRKYFEDFSGFMSDIEILQTIHVFIERMIYLGRRTQVINRQLARQYRVYSRYYDLWYRLSTKCPDRQRIESFLSLRFLFDRSIADNRVFRRVKNAINIGDSLQDCICKMLDHLVIDKRKKEEIRKSLNDTSSK